MGILVGLVLPSSDPSLHDQLRAAAQIVAADLAYARSLAVTNNSTYRFRLETDKNRYILEHRGGDRLPDSPFRNPGDPLHQQIVDFDELPQVGATVRILVAAVEASPWQEVDDLEFDALGGTGERSQQTVIWLAAGAGSATRCIELHVNPVTGLTTVGPYTGGEPSWFSGQGP